MQHEFPSSNEKKQKRFSKKAAATVGALGLTLGVGGGVGAYAAFSGEDSPKPKPTAEAPAVPGQSESPSTNFGSDAEIPTSTETPSESGPTNTETPDESGPTNTSETSNSEPAPETSENSSIPETSQPSTEEEPAAETPSDAEAVDVPANPRSLLLDTEPEVFNSLPREQRLMALTVLIKSAEEPPTDFSHIDNTSFVSEANEYDKTDIDISDFNPYLIGSENNSDQEIVNQFRWGLEMIYSVYQSGRGSENNYYVDKDLSEKAAALPFYYTKKDSADFYMSHYSQILDILERSGDQELNTGYINERYTVLDSSENKVVEDATGKEVISRIIKFRVDYKDANNKPREGVESDILTYQFNCTEIPDPENPEKTLFIWQAVSAEASL